LIEKDERVLVAQRSKTQSLPLKWEFPGGKIEPGESEAEALVREIREELGVDIAVVKAMTSVSYSYPEFSITLRPLLCRLTSGKAVPHEHAALSWCSADELRELDWAPADRPVMEEYLN
jgi:8-oxo-dGTP diphosphatase